MAKKKGLNASAWFSAQSFNGRREPKVETEKKLLYPNHKKDCNKNFFTLSPDVVCDWQQSGRGGKP